MTVVLMRLKGAFESGHGIGVSGNIPFIIPAKMEVRAYYRQARLFMQYLLPK